jgi:hypothetical protein
MGAPVASRQSPGIRVLATALLAVAIVLGSAFLWIGVPFLGLWLAGEVATSRQGFLFFVLGSIPLAMAGFGWLLYRVNDAYVRMRGGPTAAPGRSAWLVSQSDERANLRRKRAPRPLIDVAMTASAVTALVLLLVWFFFLAEMRLAPMQ